MTCIMASGTFFADLNVNFRLTVKLKRTESVSAIK